MILFFSVTNLIILFLYYLKQNKHFKILYIINWNILMLLMIFSIIISTTSGIIGFLFKDGVQMYNYIFSLDNINNENPAILITRDKFLGNLIDSCANKEEYFINIIQMGVLILTYKEKEYYEKRLAEFNEKNCNEVTKSALDKYYNEIINAIQTAYDISEDLLNIKCSFVKNNKNIIINEIDIGGSKGILLSIYQFLVGIFVAISVFFGTILVHKYEFEIENNDNQYIKTCVNVNIIKCNIYKTIFFKDNVRK